MKDILNQSVANSHHFYSEQEDHAGINPVDKLELKVRALEAQITEQEVQLAHKEKSLQLVINEKKDLEK